MAQDLTESAQGNVALAPRRPYYKPARAEPELYAALDLGTNNCRLLIATPALMVLSPYGTAYPAYLWDALSLDRRVIGEWHVLTDGDALKVAIWALATLVSVYAVRSTGTTA